MSKKQTIVLSFILVLCFILMGIIKYNTLKEYSRNYFYMDTYINVKLYTNNKDKANKALDQIDEIYKTYHNLTDRYNSHIDGLYNLNKGDTTIDYRLYRMINYADKWYDKTNGLLDITIGNLVDVWKKYREAGTGIPSLEELKSSNINHNDLEIIKDIILIDDFGGYTMNNKPVILKNNLQIDLGAISKGYTTEEVSNYLKSIGIDKFIINAGGNVVVGNHYDNKKYKIGIEDPNDSSKIYKVINATNVAVVTSGGYQRNYTYNGITYNHIINPKTLYPANNMKSVTVITSNSADADALSTTLFLMTIDEGKEFIKNYDAEVIWYSNDNKVFTTEGINKYE